MLANGSNVGENGRFDLSTCFLTPVFSLGSSMSLLFLNRIIICKNYGYAAFRLSNSNCALA